MVRCGVSVKSLHKSASHQWLNFRPNPADRQCRRNGIFRSHSDMSESDTAAGVSIAQTVTPIDRRSSWKTLEMILRNIMMMIPLLVMLMERRATERGNNSSFPSFRLRFIPHILIFYKLFTLLSSHSFLNIYFWHIYQTCLWHNYLTLACKLLTEYYYWHSGVVIGTVSFSQTQKRLT